MITKKTCISALVFMVVIFSGATLAYGAHGSSGGGGGCSGDCIPPTLGKNQQGQVLVEGGLTINSQIIDVDTYSQTIPDVLVLQIGQMSTISLKISENTSPQFLTHAEIHFGIQDKVIEGIQVEESISSIVWDGTGRDEAYGVYGDEGMFKNIKINHKIEDQFAFLTFEFEPTKSLDESTLMTIIWDEKRNVSKNYFYNAIQITSKDQPISEVVAEIVAEPIVKELEDDLKIPGWIKSNAGWWSEDVIDNSDFIIGIQYLTDNQILFIPQSEKNDLRDMGETIPGWIKNTAGWWSEDLIQDVEFIEGIQFLLDNKIIQI